jgi:hypothetical protein
MGLQSCRSLNFWEFWDSHLGVSGQNDIWVLVPWSGIENTIRGKVVASPKFEPWWVLWVHVCSWFVCGSYVHQKCSNYALTNLLFDLCKSVWVTDLHVTLLSPILELQHVPLPLKCCEPGSTPQLLFLLRLHLWIRNWVHQGTWGCVNGGNKESLNLLIIN